MKMRKFRSGVVVLLAPLFLIGCTASDIRIAADKQQPNAPTEGGIGGTGIQLAGNQGGIGGTGAPTIAAAVGTVTGFGSIHINGVRVVFPASGAVASGIGVVREADIDLGETLEVIGRKQSDGSVTPHAMMFRFPLVGRIDSFAADHSSFTVMGAQIVPEPRAIIIYGTGQRRAFRIGDTVQISGLQRNGVTVASRIERVDTTTKSSVMGRVERGPRAGTVRVNGVTLSYGNNTPPQIGWTIRATGREEDGILMPDETVRSLTETYPEPVPDATIEGYLERRPSQTGYAIGGFGHALDAHSKVQTLSGQRALFIGSLKGTEFRVRHGLSLPDDAETRRQRVEAVKDGYAPSGAVTTR